MSKQAQNLFRAFQTGQRMKLGSMTGEAFGGLMKEVKQQRKQQEAA